MLINEAARHTGLTKKAIEYYTLQGLVAPKVLENGYRDFSEQDTAVLKKIKILRKLGVDISGIRSVLADETNQALQAISLKKELAAQQDAAKKALLEKLSRGTPYAEIQTELQAVETGETIIEKLLAAFPGYYGRFVCLHFARFLNEPIQTQPQQAAYETIILFLDNIPSLDLPADLEDYLAESTQDIGTSQMKKMLESTKKSMEEPDAFLSEHNGLLERYLAYRQTEEYKSSAACRLMEHMRQFNRTSGYDDVFIPAMKQLSNSYAAYSRQLEIADEKLLLRYPEIEKPDNQSE